MLSALYRVQMDSHYVLIFVYYIVLYYVGVYDVWEF